MKTLYYVVGYHHANNEWWRFAVTAESAEAAVAEAKLANDRLSRMSATAVCQTQDEVFVEL